MSPNRALIVVDVQNDFCEGGSLPVKGGSGVALAITGHMREHFDEYTVMVATKDWHQDPGDHFSAEPDYVNSWPAHCVAGTHGAEPHPGLETRWIEAWFRKGVRSAAYSGFEGALVRSGEEIGLATWLRNGGITAVDIVGIATDHCVRATALDAVREGFDTTVLLTLTAGVAADTTSAAVKEMRAAGIHLIGEPVLA